MAKVLGLDIGGANIKATFIKTQDGFLKKHKTIIKYFPIWKKEKKQLENVLNKLKKGLTDPAELDGVGITITAELSDCYFTKKEGIYQVLTSVKKVFGDNPTFILDVQANLLSVKDALEAPLNVASANWAATGWMVSQLIKNCIVVDVGSTTTSIIPIINGEIVAEGRTDLEKLQKGELVYSGSLRTNVATIVDSIPVRGTMACVSSELFAQSGDIHLILDNIEEEDYIVETCDGRGKNKRECMARLARVVCADIDMLTEHEISDMAKFVYNKQVEQIAKGLKQVSERIKPLIQEKINVVVTGFGRNFLAKKAAKKAGFKRVIDMKECLGVEAAIGSPSVGVALLVASFLEGKNVKW
jgi:probable H4MPT-linked C1 transfer pathway protein